MKSFVYFPSTSRQSRRRSSATTKKNWIFLLKYKQLLVYVLPSSWSMRVFLFTRTWLRYTFGSLLSQFVCRLSVVCLPVTLVHPTHGVEAFGKIFFTAVYDGRTWKNLMEIVLGNPSVGSVKRKRGIKINRFWTYRRLYLINGTR